MGCDIVVVQFFAEQLYRFKHQRVHVHRMMFLLASSEQVEKALEHFIRTKGGILYLFEERGCLVDVGRRSRPEIAAPRRLREGCLTEAA